MSGEASLLARVNEGDEAAWRELVDRYAGLVWSVARSFRLSSATTDDVVQTVWLRLAEYSSRIREPERLAAWLATATRNEALRVIRGQQRTVPYAGFAEASEPTSRSIEDMHAPLRRSSSSTLAMNQATVWRRTFELRLNGSRWLRTPATPRLSTHWGAHTNKGMGSRGILTWQGPGG